MKLIRFFASTSLSLGLVLFNCASAADVQPSAGGVITLHAAAAKLVGDSIQIEYADTEANVGLWSNPADRVEWTANIPSAGTYHVEMIYAAGDNGAGGQMEVTVGAQKLSVKMDSTDGWGAYQTIDAGAVNIEQPGEVAVVVSAKSKPRDYVVNLRGVTLTDVKTWAARPKPPVKIVAKLEGQSAAPAEPLSLWYRQPANAWTEALPVGNGRIGAMVFGGVNQERLQLNEGTLWAGGSYDPVSPDARAALPEARQLVFDGKYSAAANLTRTPK